MNKKGFLLIDSLISVLIVCNLTLLCFSIYQSIIKDHKVYENYVENDNVFYKDLYMNLEYCEGCSLNESD